MVGWRWCRFKGGEFVGAGKGGELIGTGAGGEVTGVKATMDEVGVATAGVGGADTAVGGDAVGAVTGAVVSDLGAAAATTEKIGSRSGGAVYRREQRRRWIRGPALIP